MTLGRAASGPSWSGMHCGAASFARVTAYTLRATTDAEADGGGDELHTPAVSFTVAAGETLTGTALKLRHIPELEFLWLAC